MCHLEIAPLTQYLPCMSYESQNHSFDHNNYLWFDQPLMIHEHARACEAFGKLICMCVHVIKNTFLVTAWKLSQQTPALTHCRVLWQLRLWYSIEGCEHRRSMPIHCKCLHLAYIMHAVHSFLDWDHGSYACCKLSYKPSLSKLAGEWSIHPSHWSRLAEICVKSYIVPVNELTDQGHIGFAPGPSLRR